MRIIQGSGADGIIVSNTTLARTGLTDRALVAEQGGLSGRPLFARSTRMLGRVYKLTAGTMPLIGVGGIDSAEAALAKIEAGASLIQLYTGMVFEGPDLIDRIKRRLVQAVSEAHANSLAPLIGRRAERMGDKDTAGGCRVSVTIYHNPRCSKSRQTLALLEEKGVAPKIVEYLKTPPSAAELKAILKKLGLKPQEIVRTRRCALRRTRIERARGLRRRADRADGRKPDTDRAANRRLRRQGRYRPPAGDGFGDSLAAVATVANGAFRSVGTKSSDGASSLRPSTLNTRITSQIGNTITAPSRK